MAIIKCSECNKEISDKASVCVHCGNPLHDEFVKYEKWYIITQIILSISIIILFLLPWNEEKQFSSEIYTAFGGHIKWWIALINDASPYHIFRLLINSIPIISVLTFGILLIFKSNKSSKIAGIISMIIVILSSLGVIVGASNTVYTINMIPFFVIVLSVIILVLCISIKTKKKTKNPQKSSKEGIKDVLLPRKKDSTKKINWGLRILILVIIFIISFIINLIVSNNKDKEINNDNTQVEEKLEEFEEIEEPIKIEEHEYVGKYQSPDGTIIEIISASDGHLQFIDNNSEIHDFDPTKFNEFDDSIIVYERIFENVQGTQKEVYYLYPINLELLVYDYIPQPIEVETDKTKIRILKSDSMDSFYNINSVYYKID